MDQKLKSVCIMLRKDQHDMLHEKGINISGFIRDLIDDYLSENVINLNVDPDTKQLYDRIISMSVYGDSDLEPYFIKSLEQLLEKNIEDMNSLKSSLVKQKG